MAIEYIGVLLILAGIIPPWLLVRTGRHLPTSPLVLLWISQTLPLGVALLNLTGDMRPFQFTTWLVLGASFACILAGWASGTVLAGTPTPSHPTRLDPSRVGAVVAILALAYFASILQGVVRAGGFPLISSSPETARFMFMTGRLQNIFFAAGIPLFILSIHYFRVCASLWKKIAMVVILLGLVSTYLLIGSRFMTLVWLSMTLVYWDQYVGKLRVGRIAFVLTLFLLLFVLIGYFRYGKLVATASGSSKVVSIGITLAFQSVYSYIANAYWNLDHAMHRYALDQLNLHTWGISMNEGFLWVVGALPGIQKAYGWTNAMNADVVLKEGLNSTSYHWGLFKDFGIAGPLVGSFLAGAGLSFFHGRRCRDGNPGSVMIYGLACYFILGSFNLLPSVIPTPVFGMLLLVLSVFVCSVPTRGASKQPLGDSPR